MGTFWEHNFTCACQTKRSKHGHARGGWVNENNWKGAFYSHFKLTKHCYPITGNNKKYAQVKA